MCSIVVTLEGTMLNLTMNRDESRARAQELSPFSWPDGLLAPRDEAGKGTWIGVMPNGNWACLINSYELGDLPPNPPSRGGIIPHILAAQEPEETLLAMDKTVFRPFKLLLGQGTKNLRLYHWDGTTLHSHRIEAMPFFISSSSWNAEEVLCERQRIFAFWRDNGSVHDAQGIPMLNRWQEQSSPEYGILMSRELTHTTSIIQMINGGDAPPFMRYWKPEELAPVPYSAFFSCPPT